ncbi:MAG: peptidoglycan-binding protein, partial [Acutalibacteraceae bacterium]|nr:peptidoglycan-binding protein [Acutalibacteraceae bacterium]
MPDVIQPVIPESITVHLGAPGSNAENVTVPFVDYIKNVASSEIYPTWPENALRANIYAIITFALNRIYTEWYPSRGYNFDITNNTRYDQAFVPGRDIFENISDIVDNIFDEYVVRQGTIQPLFTAFCNGTTSQCDGLSQWGTVSLAEQGLTPYEILQTYYGDNISILTDTPVQNIAESYPGSPLRLGDVSNEVKIIQTQLNRIAQNYPAIPEIRFENGLFGNDTEEAVRAFQQIFSLPVTGTVDKATWYAIKRYYNGVKQLAELVSEGITIDEATLPYPTEGLSIGKQGPEIRTLQYYLDIISYFNPALEIIPINGVFDQRTEQAVKAFQRFYGLPETGFVDEATWDLIFKIYRDTAATLPQGYEGERAKIYPGYVLSEGMQNEDVRDL